MPRVKDQKKEGSNYLAWHEDIRGVMNHVGFMMNITSKGAPTSFRPCKK